MKIGKAVKWMLLLGLVVALATAAGLSQAQEPPPSEGEVQPQGDVSIAATVSSKISYQGVLKENGQPVTDSRDMTFRLYSDSNCSAQVGSDIVKSGVQVTDGLFSVDLDVTHGDFNGQGLWLEVEVGGTEIGCQEILPVPYALSLRPGASVEGEIIGWNAIYAKNTASSGYSYGVRAISDSPDGRGVSGENWGGGIGVYGYSSGGHGVYAKGDGNAHDGSALEAVNTNSSGIAIWAENNSTDTTLVVENEGTGPLIKGFGGDGGEDEFRVGNDGSIETKADSYIFIPGNEFIKNVSDEDTQWDCQLNGSVIIWSPAGAADRSIYIPITLPGVLYGRAVEVESITVYYKCEDGTQSYIDGTFLYKQTDADSRTTLVTDYTNRTSNTATSYTLNVNHTLSSDQGILGLHIALDLVAGDVNNNYVQIGGVRVRLGHHHLY